MFIKMERDELIQKGLKALLEEKLDNLESSVRSKDAIVKEVDEYLAVQRIAEKEGMGISEYSGRYSSLIEKFWEIKKCKEDQYK